MKIYTKTGDEGNTSLIGGVKVAKHTLRIESYGTIDELNSYIGLVNDLVNDTDTANRLRKIQHDLFTIGSLLACAPGKEIRMALPHLKEADVTALEEAIDAMSAALPEMRHFILPGGHVTVSHIHIARCVCRRAERACVNLQQHEPVAPIILPYLNRLSDYLFVLARYIGQQLQAPEIPWIPVV
jgi:cob(I)alamin adenosyltransferase